MDSLKPDYAHRQFSINGSYDQILEKHRDRQGIHAVSLLVRLHRSPPRAM